MDPNPNPVNDDDQEAAIAEEGPFRSPSEQDGPEIANDDPGDDDFEDVDGDLQAGVEPQPDGER